MKLLGRTVHWLNTGPARIIAAFSAGLLIMPAAAVAAGMPQLDFPNPLTTSQVVWGAIIFVVLYIILSRSGLPLVTSVLDERAAHIGHDLEGARSAKTSADAGIAEAQQATAHARAEAQAAVNTALDEAKKSAATQSDVLNARLEARLHEAETQIAQARSAAMGALRQVATDATISIVTKLTGTAPGPASLEAAVSMALTARGFA